MASIRVLRNSKFFSLSFPFCSFGRADRIWGKKSKKIGKYTSALGEEPGEPEHENQYPKQAGEMVSSLFPSPPLGGPVLRSRRHPHCHKIFPYLALSLSERRRFRFAVILPVTFTMSASALEPNSPPERKYQNVGARNTERERVRESGGLGQTNLFSAFFSPRLAGKLAGKLLWGPLALF